MPAIGTLAPRSCGQGTKGKNHQNGGVVLCFPHSSPALGAVLSRPPPRRPPARFGSRGGSLPPQSGAGRALLLAGLPYENARARRSQLTTFGIECLKACELDR